MNKKFITREKFEELRNYDEARDNVLYVVKNRDGGKVFAWSDDGVGFHFYGTYKEFKSEWGEVKV